MIHLVWRVDPETLFETQWIRELLAIGKVNYTDIIDLEGTQLLPKSVVVFNHSIPNYEAYFQRYEEAKLAYGAIHLSDETLEDTFEFYGHSMCKFVFRNYHHPVVATKYNHVVMFGLGYKTGFKKPSKLNGRYYNWSFAGNVHTQQRIACLFPFRNMIPHYVHTTNEGFNSQSGLSIEQYRELMDDSKFVICPIGQGNIDSFRVYEALEAGAIPIVLANTPLQPYQPSYWHAIFPWMRTVTIPMLIHKNWEDAAQTMAKILQNKSTYEEIYAQLQSFWSEAKMIWGVTLANYCEGLSVMQLDLS